MEGSWFFSWGGFGVLVRWGFYLLYLLDALAPVKIAVEQKGK